MVEQTDKWVIESITRLYSDELNSLYNDLVERNMDILPLFQDNEFYLRACIEAYTVFKKKRKRMAANQYSINFPAMFLRDLVKRPDLFKSIDLFIFLVQRDARNSFVLKTLLPKTDIKNYIRRHQFFNLTNYLEELSHVNPRNISSVERSKYLAIISTTKKIMEHC